MKITYEALSGLLTNRTVAEIFLSSLIGRRIRLCRPPEMALPWQSVHLFPDVEAVAMDNSVYHIYIGHCGIPSTMQELQSYARQYDGVSEELHIILLSKQPVFGGTQSYVKLGPAVLNPLSGPGEPVRTSILYHALSAECTGRQNAPKEVQQLLDILASKPVVSPGPLLNAIASVPPMDYWVDPLRLYKKQVAAKTYEKAVLAGNGASEALIKCAEAEERFQHNFLEEGCKRLNALQGDRLRQTLEGKLLKMAAEFQISPKDMAALCEGHIYSIEDVRAWYMQRKVLHI